MQINGVNDFLARFTVHPGEIAKSGNAASPFGIKKDVDTLNLSEMGKRLRFHPGDAAKLGERSAAVSRDPILSLMDKSISTVEGILEQMSALALAAQGENLTSLDRIDMQMKMEDLRKELQTAANAMSAKLAEMSGQDVAKMRAFLPEAGSPALPGEDERSLLERARDRIAKGEEWDVAESYEIFSELKKVRVGDREIQVKEGEQFELPPDVDPETAVILAFGERVGGRWNVEDDKNIPTVRQKLEASGTVVLMDAKSAARGAERIRREIDDLQQVREKFAEFASANARASSNEQNAQKMSDADVASIMEGDTSGRIIFQTQLGVMEYTDGKPGPRLTRPDSPRGSMFAMIERTFDRVSGNLAGASVSEAVSGELRFTWTNWNGSEQPGSVLSGGNPATASESSYPEGYSSAQKSDAGEALWTVAVGQQLRSWSPDVQISLSLGGTAGPGTKTVLRTDPDEDLINDALGNSKRRVYAVEITNQDPEFYKKTPVVHAIYNDASNRLSSFNGFFEYGSSPGTVVYKAVPRVNAIYFEATISQSWSYERFF
jgi:hypothetical protein